MTEKTISQIHDELIASKGSIDTPQKAVELSLLKWGTIKTALIELENLYDCFCGFCYYCQTQVQYPSDKCTACPPQIKKLCGHLMEHGTEPFERLRELANSAIDTISEWKAEP